MLKILINNEEVVCDKQLEIKEEMLSTSSCILNNCYPKSWENTKNYTSLYYYPKDYSKCLIYNSKEPRTITQSGTTLTFDDLINPTLQDLQIKGNTLQNGTPTPTNPKNIEIVTGEQNIKIQGANLFNYKDTSNVTTGVIVDEEGWITVTCDNTSGTSTKFFNYITNNLNLLTGTNYNIIVEVKSVSGTGRVYSCSHYVSQGQFLQNRYKNFSDLTNNSAFAYSATTKSVFPPRGGIRSFVQFATGQSGSITFRISVIKDLTITPETFVYREYQEQNYPINLGNIELCKIGNYQDYIYKQNGNWYIHKVIDKVVLNGTETNVSISKSGTVNWFYSFKNLNQNTPGEGNGYVLSNYYKATTIYTSNTNEGICVTRTSKEIRIRYGQEDTLSNFLNWVSNHNIEVYYVMTTPIITQITDTTLITQLENVSITKGNNYVTTENNTLLFDISMTIYDSGTDLLFSGIIKNTGNINLNPRYPHYCNLEVLDFKTFLSECDQLDFVINNKTITEAIEQVTQAIANYGFVVGNTNINDNTIIGAYSTQEKTPYDVFQYLADISQSRWYTRLIDENTVAIDFYDPTAMQRGIDLDFSNNTFACQNNIEDLSFNYGTYDYRNKQIMLSNQVFGGVDFEETIIADGYNKIFNTTTPIGILKGITVNGSSSTFATNEDKELGLETDFYYTPGNTQIESNENDGAYTANTIIMVEYTPLVKGRQVLSNTTEINRIATQTGRNGIISRYEKRNDVLSSDELELIGNSYLKYKGTPEINLTLVTKDVDLYDIGQIVYFNYPNIEDLSQDYMVKSKKTRIINTATDWNIWYTYILTSNFNSENAINYFDNQRAKSTGNIKVGDYITRNIDIENTANIIWDNLTITEVTPSRDNVLNSVLNSPFIQ